MSLATSLRSVPFKIHYEGKGETILAGFVQPALSQCMRYDRMTGYFSVHSLLAVAEGIEGLWRRGGKMRLLMGIHEVPSELLKAADDAGWVDRVVAAVRQRLLAEISDLATEIHRNRIATLAWMLKDGLLEVRVAAPVHSHGRQGIFHPKRFIFVDGAGDVVSAVGSANETVAGLGSNWEEIDVHRSWEDQHGFVFEHRASFEALWNGERADLAIRELSADLAGALLAAVHRDSPPQVVPQTMPGERETLSTLIEVMKASSGYFLLAGPNAVLYPHQERAALDALARDPIRVMLSDEVGLGKTLEAAAVIAFALRHRGVRRVAILAPAALTKQWQDELLTQFGIQSWLYDASQKGYSDPAGSFRGTGKPFSAKTPDIVVVSAQLARGDTARPHALRNADWVPELLVVDEAHAARTRVELDGSTHRSLLYRMLEEVAPTIPHVLLLTATPMQLAWQEYHSLLVLLGLPAPWDEESFYEQLMKVHAGDYKQASLDSTRSMLIGLKVVRATFGVPDPSGLPAQIAAPISTPLGVALTAMEAAAAYGHRAVLGAASVQSHPANLLTIRHTRRALASLGYAFPRRRFSAPVLEVPEQVREFYSAVETYLHGHYGEVEGALRGSPMKGKGLAISAYYQRMASTLHAASCTVRSRLNAIESLLSKGTWKDEVVAEDEDASESALPDQDETALLGETVKYAAKMEMLHLRDLLGRVEQLTTGGADADPKLAAMSQVVRTHLKGGGRVLIFSRYTDSLQSALALWPGIASDGNGSGHALYTGGEVWIDRGRGRVPADKSAIRDALRTGAVRVVFCSDAASEGLNLQAADMLINIDVPWNPGRLEQRIGRIARLGQRSEEVQVCNLWYPQSIEAKMYTRLLTRQEDFERAVGEFPDIMAKAISAELTGRFTGAGPSVGPDPLRLLQDHRNDLQLQALNKVWGAQASATGQVAGSLTLEIRRALSDLLVLVATSDGFTVASANGSINVARGSQTIEWTVIPGAPNSLSLGHPALELLRHRTVKSSSAQADDEYVIESIRLGEELCGVAVRRGTERRGVPPQGLPVLLRALAFEEKVAASVLKSWPLVDDAEAARYFSAWRPDSRKLNCLGPPRTDKAGSGERDLRTESVGDMSFKVG